MRAIYLPPQKSTAPDTPLPYTASPWKLLWEDLRLFFRNAWRIPSIILPLTPWNSGELDELYPSIGNICGVTVQLVLSVLQILFLVSLPVCLVCMVPALWVGLYMAGFVLLNKAVCDLYFNRGERVLVSSVPEKTRPGYAHEHWIFINGVAVGHNVLQNNIDRLGYTFGRKVTGVHNPTTGVVFDIIQCLIQRNFSYATGDVRDAYALTKAALNNPQHKKVVLIVHSQGGIEGGLIIDWLLDEIPQGLLRKLEIYTFGNAANHFNNPYRTVPAPHTEIADTANSRSLQSSDENDNTILHIEHYANSDDLVSVWGVLNFSNIPNRYMGRVFVRPGSGHQFNQHYMDTMFTLGPDRKVLDSNEFMDMDVECPGFVANPSDSRDKEGDGQVTESERSSSDDMDATHHSVALADARKSLKVKDLSRPWLYRNGGSPE